MSTAQDSFNRADTVLGAGLGIADSGHVWADFIGVSSWTINANSVLLDGPTLTGQTFAGAVVDVGGPVETLSVDVTVAVGGAAPCVFFHVAAADTFLVVIVIPTVTVLYKSDGGALALIDNQANTIVAGETVTLELAVVVDQITVSFPTHPADTLVYTLTAPELATFSAGTMAGVGGSAGDVGSRFDDFEAVFTPPIPPPPVIPTVGFIPSVTGVIAGPVLVTPPVGDYYPRITAAAYSRAGALQATLSKSHARRWQDQHNETGSGQLALQNDDADLAAIGYSSVILFSLDGQARFAALVEKLHRITVDPNEEVEQTTTVSGRGRLAIFEEAIVQPTLGVDRAVIQDTRVFNFATPSYDDAFWGLAVVTDHASLAGYTEPRGWPDDDALWIWDRISWPPANPPHGENYFRTTFVLADRTVGRLWAAADDAYEVWLDGSLLFSDGWDIGYVGQSRYTDAEMDAGTHYLAVRARNKFGAAAGFRLAIQELDGTGTPSGVILLRSDATWKVLGYPDPPPGFTPGEVIRLLVEEAQARGSLVGVVLAFDDYADSAGVPWAAVADIAVQVGADLLQVIKQIGETYVDVTMAVGTFTLFAYVSRGSTRPAVLAAGVNLGSLHHRSEI